MTLQEPTTPAFKANARAALGDRNLQSALRNARGNFVLKRAKARRRVSLVTARESITRVRSSPARSGRRALGENPPEKGV